MTTTMTRERTITFDVANPRGGRGRSTARILATVGDDAVRFRGCTDAADYRLDVEASPSYLAGLWEDVAAVSKWIDDLPAYLREELANLVGGARRPVAAAAQMPGPKKLAAGVLADWLEEQGMPRAWADGATLFDTWEVDVGDRRVRFDATWRVSDAARCDGITSTITRLSRNAAGERCVHFAGEREFVGMSVQAFFHANRREIESRGETVPARRKGRESQ